VQFPGLFRVPALLLRGVSSVLTLGVRVRWLLLPSEHSATVEGLMRRIDSVRYRGTKRWARDGRMRRVRTQVAASVLRTVVPVRVRGLALSLLRALQRPALSPVEAATAFVAAFEQRYGAVHPEFVVGSYRDALTMANRDFKFLLVYLHSPEHQVRALV
jgi:hypothetical protein